MTSFSGFPPSKNNQSVSDIHNLPSTQTLINMLAKLSPKAKDMTEQEIAERAANYLTNNPNITNAEIELLKHTVLNNKSIQKKYLKIKDEMLGLT